MRISQSRVHNQIELPDTGGKQRYELVLRRRAPGSGIVTFVGWARSRQGFITAVRERGCSSGPVWEVLSSKRVDLRDSGGRFDTAG